MYARDDKFKSINNMISIPLDDTYILYYVKVENNDLSFLDNLIL